MKRLLLACIGWLCIPFMLEAQSLLLDLEVTDGLHTTSVQLGFAPGASDGIGPEDDLLPPPPPRGVFDVRTSLDLQTDIRQPTGTLHRFNLELRPSDNATLFTVRWDPAQINGRGTFKLNSILFSEPINMVTVDSAQIAVLAGIPTPLSVEATPDNLPIELISFEATQNNLESIQLNWRTATEQINAGFEVQRAVTGTPQWQNIGFVEGHGTTLEPNDYSFEDRTFSVTDTVLYYRLKQIDFDGGFSYSPVVEFRLIDAYNYFLMPPFPNPSNGSTRIRFGLPETDLVRLRVFDPMGRLMYTLVDGVRAEGWHEVTLPTANLPAGRYFYQLETELFSTTRKLVILP